MERTKERKQSEFSSIYKEQKPNTGQPETKKHITQRQQSQQRLRIYRINNKLGLVWHKTIKKKHKLIIRLIAHNKIDPNAKILITNIFINRFK